MKTYRLPLYPLVLACLVMVNIVNHSKDARLLLR
jgi:hypothetical protein